MRSPAAIYLYILLPIEFKSHLREHVGGGWDIQKPTILDSHDHPHCQWVRIQYILVEKFVTNSTMRQTERMVRCTIHIFLCHYKFLTLKQVIKEKAENSGVNKQPVGSILTWDFCF